MQLLNRLVMGLSVIVLLIPVAGIALPNGLEDLAFWEEVEQETGPVAAAVDAASLNTPGDDSTESSVDHLTCTPPGCTVTDEDGVEASGPRSINVNSPVTTTGETTSSSAEALKEDNTGESESTTPTSQKNESTTSTTQSSKSTSTTPTTTKSTATTSTTSSTSTTATTQPPSAKTDGTITGNACPCTVTGTVELKGEVNLKGDITVKGGTLVARPGVTVNGNRFQIMFMDGGKADFRGTPTSTWSGDGSNANLKRDIEFRNLRRIMFHDTAPSVLSYISVIDSGTTGVTDDYPLHWHHSGNSSRGTVVEGVVVLNGKNHAYVTHASHGITLKNVIAKNIMEEAFWWNTPRMAPCSRSNPCTANDSHDIRIDHALADGVDGSSTRVAAFLLGQGHGNVLVNSLTRNVGSSQQCSGYKWATDMHSNWVFSNNRALDPNGTCGNGIFVWQNLQKEDPQPLVQNFKSDLAIEHGAYRNFYTYDNIDVAVFISHARSYTVKNSAIDEVRIVKNKLGGGVTTFSNVTIGKVIVMDGADEPAKFVFENTNITCADVDLENAHSGSEIIVNGTDCNA